MPFAPLVNDGAVQAVGQAMRDHSSKFITPVCRSPEHTYGEVEGSGTFLEFRGQPYLLTNEHVVRARTQYRLAHFLNDGELAAAVIHPFRCVTEPEDVAVARIDADILAGSTKRGVPASRIDPTFQPADGEIVFIHGYPGVQSRFSALSQGVIARTCPYSTDLNTLPPGFDLNMHFAITYPTQGVRDFQGRDVHLPDPPGMSGSLVWDTKYVAMNGTGWGPSDAKACGLIWAWDMNNQLLIGTKIEFVRAVLITHLRLEAAYFRSLRRDAFPGDALSDWLWAERELTSLE